MSVAETSRAVTIGYRLVTFLMIVAAGFGALLVVDAASGVARGGDRLVGGNALDVHLQYPMERLQLPVDVAHSDWLPVTVHLDDPTGAQIALSAGLDLTQVILLVVGLWFLWGLARSVRHGTPFDQGNVRRLRGLGFLLALGAPAAEIVNWALRLSLFDSLPEDRFGDFAMDGLNVPGAAMVAGLGAFILAEVFAQGLRLREDVEGTV